MYLKPADGRTNSVYPDRLFLKEKSALELHFLLRFITPNIQNFHCRYFMF